MLHSVQARRQLKICSAHALKTFTVAINTPIAFLTFSSLHLSHFICQLFFFCLIDCEQLRRRTWRMRNFSQLRDALTCPHVAAAQQQQQQQRGNNFATCHNTFWNLCCAVLVVFRILYFSFVFQFCVCFARCALSGGGGGGGGV